MELVCSLYEQGWHIYAVHQSFRLAVLWIATDFWNGNNFFLATFKQAVCRRQVGAPLSSIASGLRSGLPSSSLNAAGAHGIN